MRFNRLLSFVLIVALFVSQGSMSVSFASSDGITGLKMTVTDTKGPKTAFEGTNKIISDTEALVNGDANLSFEGNSSKLNLSDIKYKFVKKSDIPNAGDFTNESNWQNIDVAKNKIIKMTDVLTDKKGYLTWRSYNVDHLGTMADGERWSKREEVYKNPSNEIKYQRAITSTEINQYISKQNNKFITSSVFLQNMKIGYTNEFAGYKEASKFWGYLSPVESGTYYFGVTSDDGSYAYIVDDTDKKVELVDRSSTISSLYPNAGFFYPHGRGWNTLNKPVKLTSGKNYPIYLEYFNWGGEADFEFFYNKNSNIDVNNKKTVPDGWFYPSKTNTPGEYADSTFQINEGVNFPSEPGKYYVCVKNGTDNGYYGPFIIAPKASFDIKREVMNGNSFIVQNEAFEFKYSITPKPIPISDVGNSSSIASLTVKNFKIKETFPDVLNVDANGSGTVNGKTFESTPRDVVFTKNTQTNCYEASPVSVTIKLTSTAKISDLVLGANKTAMALYTDMDSSNQVVNFDEIKISTTKLKEFNVLEIQPARDFELNANRFSGMAEKINIDQMSMNEFISKVDKLNGKYDAVYIGSNKAVYNKDNDITDRKLAEVKEYFASKQLLIFNNSIDATVTKIGSYLSELKKNNAQLDTTTDIINYDIRKAYGKSSKRPIITVNSKPDDFNSNVNNLLTSKSLDLNYNLVNLNLNNSYSNPMVTKLYFDKNGDGLFKDDEIVQTNQACKDGNNYSIGSNVNLATSGLMPYKLEITDTINNAKSYVTGFPAYKGDMLKIRVLQIAPGPNKNNLDLTDNILQQYLKTSMYNIEVTKITVDNFNASPTVLNGNFDMVIIGFQDRFAGENSSQVMIEKDFSDSASKAIKDYIKTGQSVMFTHDTIGAGPNKKFKFTPNFTNNLKSSLGFSDENTRPGKLEFNATYDDTNGQTWRAWGSKGARKINDGTVTKFPYNINDIAIASTHDQYWTLDLEQEVIPWYTLMSNQGAEYDPKNNYYIFSKGNITYSGAGHSKIAGTLNDEVKLFINTMLKASKNSNHAPTLKVVNLDENKIIPKSLSELNFSFIADDIDGDDLCGEILIDNVVVKKYDFGNIKLKEPVNVNINKGEMDQFVGNKENFELKIVVKDRKDAMAQEKSNFTIKIMDNPLLLLKSTGSSNYLVGDTGAITLTATSAKISDNLNTVMNNINYSLENNNAGIAAIGDTSWKINDITFNPNPTPNNQTKEFKFDIKAAGNYTIKNNINYTYTNFNLKPISDSYSYTVSAKSSNVKINVKNIDATAFKDASVRIYNSQGYDTQYKTDSYGVVNLDNLKTGSYNVELVNLPSNLVVKGDKNIGFNLSYDNPVFQNIFELIDKNKVGVEITAGNEIKALLGDSIMFELKALANNIDANINTVIGNFKYNMNIASDFETADAAWQLQNVSVTGLEVTNKEQRKQFTLKTKNSGNFGLGNTLSYEFIEGNLKGIQELKSTVQKISVKKSAINVIVKNTNNTGYANVAVEIKSGGIGVVSGKTDSLGKFTLYDMPSGNYTASIHLPNSYVADGGNDKSFNLSYDNPSPNIEFKFLSSAGIINTGVLEKSKIKTATKLVKGFDAILATEFETYDVENDFRLTLDNEIKKATFELYEVDSNGNLGPAITNITVKTIDNGNETVLTGGNKVDFAGVSKSNASGMRFKIQWPSNGKSQNHYILAYTIKQNAPVGYDIKTAASINNSGEKAFNIKVIPLPKIQ